MSTPSDSERLRALFQAALLLPPGERLAFAETQTSTEPDLGAELLEMLKSQEDSTLLAVPSSTPPSLQDGELQQQIGIYRLLREIGRGGMGTVYLAARSDDAFQKLVALKVISDGSAGDDFVKRFRQERQILASLDHPNIARILDGGATSDGRPYYVLEYVEGHHIDVYCDRIRADVGQRVMLFTQVCDAVEYLHGQSIIHRDIKPSNILVSADGHAKLLDFGIAKVQAPAGFIGASTNLHQPTMVMTPAYASPEQITGRQVTRSTDIYSLGTMLYQLLTGQLPYTLPDGGQDLTAKLSAEAPEAPSRKLGTLANRTGQDPADFRRQLRGDLDLVVLTSLQTEPSKRYATVRDFSDDLKRSLEGRPISAKPTTVPYQVRKLLQRNKLVTGLAVALALVAVVGAGFAIQVQVEKARVAAKEDEIERYLSFLSTRVDRWQPDSSGAMAASPSDKISDMLRLGQVISSDIPTIAVSSRASPERERRMVGLVVVLLDRADRLSVDEPVVRKEVFTVYQQTADLQSSGRVALVEDKPAAIENYQRAAGIAASVGPADRAWMETQLAQIEARLTLLGAQINVPLPIEPAPEPAPAATSAAAPPRPASEVITEEVSPPPAVNAAELAEAAQRLRMDESKAARAHENLDGLRRRLALQGQSVRGDTSTAMARVDLALEDARSSLASNDSSGAQEALRRAEYDLARVLQAVGN